MARTSFELKYNCSYNNAKAIICKILSNNGYKETSYKNETVWKCGTGMMTAMKFVKVEYGNSSAVISGWICTGIGNMTGEEMALTGVVGALPKKQVINVLNEIKTTLLAAK